MLSTSRVFLWLISVLGLMVTGWTNLAAQVPNTIGYSGLLADARGEPRDGQWSMTFRIYDSPMGGTLLGNPQTIPNVSVRKGQFNVLLGPFPDTVFQQGSGERYLEAQVGTEPPLLPRQRLISVPFAQRAISADLAQRVATLNIVGPTASAGTGTLTSNGVMVTGSGTAFDTQLHVGDALIAQGQARIITAIQSAGSLTTNAAFTPALQSAPFTLHPPVAQLTDSAGSTQFMLNSQGNLGIGTTNPAGKLHVSGGPAFVDGNLSIGTTSPAAKLHTVGSSPSNGRGRVTSSGVNVTGQGTTFNTELHVGDAIIAQGQTRIIAAINGPSSLTTVAAFAPALQNAPFTFQFPIVRLVDSGGATQFVLNGQGNVGIGTARPAEKLEVAGDIKASNVRATDLVAWSNIAAAGNVSAGNVYASGEVYVRGQPVRNFGGAFTGGVGYPCYNVNPFTGACTCPAGFTGITLGGCEASSPYPITITCYPGTVCVRGGAGATPDEELEADLAAAPGQNLLPDRSAVVRRAGTETQLEDFGRAQLIDGQAIVPLDSRWMGAVNAATDYQVFLTPKGDCEGLYVARQTTTAFEVRELRKGKSTIPFDYRVIVERKSSE